MNDPLIQRFDSVLERVPEPSASAYLAWKTKMAAHVTDLLCLRQDLEEIIGVGNREVMALNHENHADYIGSVLEIKSGMDLVSTVTWVYRSYTSRGFSFEYFPIELNAWREAVARFLIHDDSETILEFYDLLLDSHPYFCAEARAAQDGRPDQGGGEARALEDRYIAALLEPNAARAINLAQQHISSLQDVRFWWEEVITPAMVEIGHLWEVGQISVGQEHLASSITQRVIALFYPLIVDRPRDRGPVILAATPGELHEIGARMAADLLEMNGWNVHYTGADTPWESLASLLQRFETNRLCLSVTLPTNLPRVKHVIAQIRNAISTEKLLILVGGQAFQSSPDLWKEVDASAYAADIDEANHLLGVSL